MKGVDLSIIIVNYNTKKLLGDCLESIAKNSQGIKKEIIVVDNGSTDGSRQYLKTLSQRKVKTILNKANLGFAKANNQGIKKASGRYIFLLNSDTLVKAGALRTLIDFSQKKVKAGVVGPRLINPDGSLQPSCSYLPSFFGALKEFWLGKKGAFTKYSPRGKKPVAVEAVVGAAFLIPRKVIEKVGLLDEKYFFYFEDLDYCRRARKIKKIKIKPLNLLKK